MKPGHCGVRKVVNFLTKNNKQHREQLNNEQWQRKAITKKVSYPPNQKESPYIKHILGGTRSFNRGWRRMYAHVGSLPVSKLLCNLTKN